MDKLKLPFWLGGEKPGKLRTIAQAWWEKVEGWLTWPLAQLDVLTAALALVNIVAWERGIKRFDGEPESLYRKRVKFAFINAQDAGSVAGFQRIFQRLEIGFVNIVERSDGQDWDIVSLQLNDSQISQNTELLQVIVQMYGRTCRRYIFETLTTVTAVANVQTMGDDHSTVVAT